MIEQIYLSLILIGTTIGAVLLVLWLRARNAGRTNLALIRLNEQLNFDAPAFLRGAWPLLAQAGLRGISWKLDWFGTPVEGQSGHLKGPGIDREIQVEDMKLSIRFQLNKQGEQRYFDENLIETFLLLLRTDMWIKAGATDATFAQMSKLTLFLQHDMKNVAQFIQLMADQLAIAPVEKERQVLDYLRIAAPLVRHRADRIVRTLTLGQAQREPLRDMQLEQELTQMCGLHRLDCSISGTARIRVPENTLDSALDNVLKNYSDIHMREQGTKPLVSIAIETNPDKVDILIQASNTPPVAHVERLFEPFWSSDPTGLGIGLYQAKQLLELCAGTISAHTDEAGQLRFVISIPQESGKG